MKLSAKDVSCNFKDFNRAENWELNILNSETIFLKYEYS